MDDSSSVTSAASSLTAKLNSCHLKTCSLRVESLPMKPLVPCGRCSHRWHPNCHDPPIHDVYWNTNEWRCTRCSKKSKTTMLPAVFSSTPKLPDNLAPRCRVCSRDLPFFQPGGKQLCKIHEMEDRHKNAQAAKARSAAQSPALARDIKKKKLYPFKPCDTYSREDMRAAKCKRQVSNERSASHSGWNSITPLQRVPTFRQSNVPDSIINPNISDSWPFGATNRPSQTSTMNSSAQECTLHAEKFVVVSPEYEPPPASRAEHIRPGSKSDSMSGSVLSSDLTELSTEDGEFVSFLETEQIQKSETTASLDRVDSPTLPDIFGGKELNLSTLDIAKNQKTDVITTITHGTSGVIQDTESSNTKSDRPSPSQPTAISRRDSRATIPDNVVTADQPNAVKCPVCRNGNQRCLGGYPCTRCLQYKRDTRDKCLDENYKKRRSSLKNRNQELSIVDSEDNMDFDLDPDTEMIGSTFLVSQLPTSSSYRPEVKARAKKLSTAKTVQSNPFQVLTPLPFEMEATSKSSAQLAESQYTEHDSEYATIKDETRAKKAAIFEEVHQMFANMEGARALSSRDPFCQEVDNLIDKRLEAPGSSILPAPGSRPPLKSGLSITLQSTSQSPMPQAKRNAYDSTILDTYLGQQIPEFPFREPNSEDLAETQIWAHIDPREKWSKRYSKGWLAEKRSEIESRGGRKANIGKLLTPQVRKERSEKRWSTHQSKAVVHDAEGSKILDELFMIKNADRLVPGVKNACLVMIEKEGETTETDDNGRKKRKAALQCYALR